jgi:small subunit ribosomal protein S15
MKLLNKDKKDIIKKFRRHEKDTGSPEVQISLLTKRINKLTEHLKSEDKDFHSRRGLEIMVSRRKKLLNYLRRKDIEKFNKIKKELDLRL